MEELLHLVFQQGMRQICLGTAIVVILTVFREFFTRNLSAFLEWCLGKMIIWLDPRVEIRFIGGPDKNDESKNEEAYKAIETYLSVRRSAYALGLKANSVRDISTPVLLVDNGRGVSDEFNGVTVWWHHGSDVKMGGRSAGCGMSDRYFVLTFRQKNREMVVEEYLRRVLEEGQAMVKEAQATMEAMMEEDRAMRVRRRELRLYTNNPSPRAMLPMGMPMGMGNGRTAGWGYGTKFNHPAKFENFAMEDEKKEDIMKDLDRFSRGREYYRRIGKPWKRGYLLYGPPGTGKSTMIAAMANYIGYDVYSLELTTVSDNDALKSLMENTPGKSIIVIEDIDCSSDITGHRDREKNPPHEVSIQVHQVEPVTKTLSGLLNCVDGLFTADDGGRLIVFTTNNKEALDPALVRTGRMDKHIELTYCGMEAFKILAKVYLRIEEHELFGRIEELLNKCSITPADVGETLLGRDGEAENVGEEYYYLNKLIGVLEEKCEMIMTSSTRTGRGRGRRGNAV